jgi:hypothetical protein
LNKSPTLNFAGDAEATGLAAAAAPAFVRARFPFVEDTGEDAAAGLAAVAASACLRVRFALADAAGDAAGEGDAAVSPDEAAVSDFLCARCFVGS